MRVVAGPGDDGFARAVDGNPWPDVLDEVRVADAELVAEWRALAIESTGVDVDRDSGPIVGPLEDHGEPAVRSRLHMSPREGVEGRIVVRNAAWRSHRRTTWIESPAPENREIVRRTPDVDPFAPDDHEVPGSRHRHGGELHISRGHG